jgi:hypothetical protein
LLPFSCKRTHRRWVLHENVLDLYCERRADAREGINHKANQRAVAKAGGRHHVDAVDAGSDVQRCHLRDRRNPGNLAPIQEFPRRLRVRSARVSSTDVGGEEFEKAGLRLGAGDSDKNGGLIDTERDG